MALQRTTPDERPELGFGLLGYGFMGKAHSNALSTIPYIFDELAVRPARRAIAGRSEAGVARAATRYGFAAHTTDWRELLEDPEVQVFDNVAGDAAHVEPTLAALQAGRHVVCEKPLASTAADAQRLSDAAEAAQTTNLVCFNYRFFPAVRLAWEMVRGGELGELHQARFRYSQAWRTDPDAELPSPVGALDIIASHAIDQARFLCGEIRAVSGAIATPVSRPGRSAGGREVDRDDVVAFIAELDGGLLATVDASLVSPGRRNHLSWELNGSRGSVVWDLEHPNLLRVHRADGGRTAGFAEVIACEEDHPLAAAWWPTGHVLGWEHGHINMLAHFCAAAAAGRSVGPEGATFHDGLRAAQVAEAVRRSADEGRRIEVADAPAPERP
jgi:predicted dehydrogenase